MSRIKWRSYDGRELYIDEMTHEHLSSLYYFMTYVSKRQSEDVIIEIKRVIDLNFGGIILPYNPPPDVLGEIEILHSKGLLRYDKEKHQYDIIDGDIQIGQIILRPDHEIDELTGLFKEDRVAKYKEKRQNELMLMALSLQNQMKETNNEHNIDPV